jgi:hypothetical protein
MEGSTPRFPIRDRDEKFGATFDRVAEGAGTRVIRTAVRTPNMNPVGERFVGSLRREALDHVFLLDDQNLENVAWQYVRHFNQARPHQGMGQRIPDGPVKRQPRRQGQAPRSRPRPGQLHSDTPGRLRPIGSVRHYRKSAILRRCPAPSQRVRPEAANSSPDHPWAVDSPIQRPTSFSPPHVMRRCSGAVVPTRGLLPIRSVGQHLIPGSGGHHGPRLGLLTCLTARTVSHTTWRSPCPWRI